MTARIFLWKHASALPWCCRCLVYRKDSVLRADCRKSQPKGPDRRRHVCMSANEFVNMAQTMLGVTTCDENVTKVALALQAKEMEKEMQKGMALKEMAVKEMEKEMEKGMAFKEMERRWRRGWLSRRWRRGWLSRRWRWRTVQRSDTDICNTNICP